MTQPNPHRSGWVGLDPLIMHTYFMIYKMYALINYLNVFFFNKLLQFIKYA